jgi:hypothetical protein
MTGILSNFLLIIKLFVNYLNKKSLFHVINVEMDYENICDTEYLVNKFKILSEKLTNIIDIIHLYKIFLIIRKMILCTE